MLDMILVDIDIKEINTQLEEKYKSLNCDPDVLKTYNKDIYEMRQQFFVSPIVLLKKKPGRNIPTLLVINGTLKI